MLVTELVRRFKSFVFVVAMSLIFEIETLLKATLFVLKLIKGSRGSKLLEFALTVVSMSSSKIFRAVIPYPLVSMSVLLSEMFVLRELIKPEFTAILVSRELLSSSLSSTYCFRAAMSNLF